MITTNALGQLAPVVMGLVGIVQIMRARRRPARPDTEAEQRRASAAEMERRMASYLASREDGR